MKAQVQKVLIANKSHPLLNEGLRDIGYEVDYRPEIKYEEFLQEIPHYCGVVVNTRNPVKRDAIDRGEKLEFIARLGSGLDIIDVEYAMEKEIQVFSAPEGNANAVAEHAISMLFCLFNKIHLADRSVRAFKWEREEHRGRELSGLTVGVIGYGNNGSAFERKLRSLGVKTLCYDKYKQHYLNDKRLATECESMEAVLAGSDIISLHIPLTLETRGMVDARFLDACKDQVSLINTSRGAIVNLEDLLKFHEKGKIYGTCLDVLPNENLSELSRDEKRILEGLMQYNVIFTPHIAGWSTESFKKISKVLIDKLEQWRRGR